MSTLSAIAKPTSIDSHSSKSHSDFFGVFPKKFCLSVAIFYVFFYREDQNELTSAFTLYWIDKSLVAGSTSFLGLLQPKESAPMNRRNDFDIIRVSDHRIRKALRHLVQKPQLRARHLAKLARLSSSHFRHRFKAETGMSTGQLALKLQLHRAKRFIDDGYTSLKGLRKKLGFRHAANFSRAFKRLFGISPSVYLRRKLFSEIAKKSRKS